MRLSTSSSFLFLALCSKSAVGFVTPNYAPSNRQSSLSSPSALAVTAEQAAERARAAANMALKPVPQPKLYDDDLLTDMQQCLLKLERRVKDGPGALSMLEVEEFGFATQRILDEMKLNEHNRPKPAPAFPDALPVEEETAQQPAATAVAAPKPTETLTTRPQAQKQTQQLQTNKPKVIDKSNDEGPAYDGTGGLGMAKDTVNTYVIPGMDEMSPDEYQKALQKSISDRQAKRVAQGNYGNRNSSDYLDNLGQGTAGTGMVKKWDPKKEN